MRFKIYVSIEGPDFDPEAFNAGLEPDVKGSVCERIHLNKKSTNQRIYWESKQLPIVSGYPEDGLLELLSSLGSHLKKVASTTTKVSAVIIEICKESESPRGFYVSSALVEALFGFRSDLDLDIQYELDM